MDQARFLPCIVVTSLVRRGLARSPSSWRRGAYPVALSRYAVAERLESCHGLLALAALDLRVDLIGARIQQVYSTVLQGPKITVQCQVFVAIADPFARHHYRGFQAYR